MPSAQQYLNCAASYIGVSGTDNIFNTWIWGQHCYNPDIYPWCAAFQSYVANEVGLDCCASASASGFATQFDRVADEDVQPGDLVVFNWDGRQDTGWCDHIGVVEWFDHSSGYFGTIEGNTGNTSGGEVMRQTRYNYTYYFTAFYRPNYTGGDTVAYHEQEPGERKNKLGMAYRAHVSNMGWLDVVHDGQTAGTVGNGLPLECIKIDPPEGVVLEVHAHISNVGWKTYSGIETGESRTSKQDPEIGTTGRAYAIEGLTIRCTKNTTGKQLRYQAHQAGIGWTSVAGEYEFVGSEGNCRPIEAIRIWME